ncbi:hypothetical protein J132_00125 [Termitomyces sp. J132]|nr:hypothetical protein H2248_001882 [Termitomyces sp. 'cryptogamus']KNZ82310.1 hypothetical protein J132_00125 [Termitomyces sp. J132]
MSRKQVPDLDSLESPLISANPFGPILGVVPGTALAERIFNDPDSWQGADDDDGDLKDAEAMRWLADEVGMCQANRDFPPVDRDIDIIDRDIDIMLKSLSERLSFTAPASEKLENWDDIAQENKQPFLPLFDHTLSLNVDLRFSKIWDTQGKMLHSPRSPISPTNESKTLPSARLAAPPALDLDAAEDALSPVISPFTVASASTTWSILEWYGVHPNTPRILSRVPFLTHSPSTPYHAKQPALSSLREPSSPSANATVTTPPFPLSIPGFTEFTSIRRLPDIPDLARTTPSKPLISPQESTPERTPKRIKSPDGPLHFVMTHQRSASASVAPSGSTSRLRRTPCGSATIPVPSGSPDPFNSSPNVTPIRTGTLFNRSPPAGPRPRLGTNPMRQRQASGRDSPSPIVIEPAPTPTRVRKPSPPPGLHLYMAA